MDPRIAFVGPFMGLSFAVSTTKVVPLRQTCLAIPKDPLKGFHCFLHSLARREEVVSVDSEK
jgi:hypothetical protein